MKSRRPAWRDHRAALPTTTQLRPEHSREPCSRCPAALPPVPAWPIFATGSIGLAQGVPNGKRPASTPGRQATAASSHGLRAEVGSTS
ncbi:hypothetical protein ACRAWD_30935 [Caulobacter segnis]